jgi:UbiD family decarboxylase
MRSWTADLQAAGELIRIDKPVDPLTEMGSLLYQSRKKALLFEKLPHRYHPERLVDTARPAHRAEAQRGWRQQQQPRGHRRLPALALGRQVSGRECANT